MTTYNETMQKQLFIIAGPNGSGKTTLAKEFLSNVSLIFLNADEIAAGINSENLQSVRITAGKILLNKIDKLFQNKQSFAIESTLAGNYLIKFIHKARSLGYKISIIYFFVDNPDVCINRIKIRVSQGGHSVPDEDVKRRYYRSKKNFWYKYKNLADDWIMLYNGIEKVIPVAFGSLNNIEIADETLSGLFQEDI
jgi:predicted ABC-type ATPase